MSPAIIVGMDGTLSSCAWRVPFIPNWKKFFDGMGHDAVVPAVKDAVIHAYFGGCDIVVVTGRPDNYASVVTFWLDENNIPVADLYMRKEGDYRDDAIVKREIYNNHIEPKYDVKYIIDDRESVVEMWRNELGLPVFQVVDPDIPPVGILV